jgi:hypothetical protein
MYGAALLVHSWVRWVVIAAGLAAVVRSVRGAASRGTWTPRDDRAGFWFVMALDLQATIGLVLYLFLSPFTRDAMHDLGAAMKNAGLRFWAVEHTFGMLVGLVLAHVGRARTRKASSLSRHKVAAIFFGLALLAILASIPWPGTPNGRPWVRW